MIFGKSISLLIILPILLLVIFTGCGANIQESNQPLSQESTEKAEKETLQAPLDTSDIPNSANLVEQYYPLSAGSRSTPVYSPDFAHFYEEVLLREGNRALVLTSIGARSSDIKVYEIENDFVYEILRLEDGRKDNNYDYDSVLKLVMDRDFSELNKFIKNADDSEKTIILKTPFTVGTKWDCGEIIDFDNEQELQREKDYINKGKPIPDSDTIVVKYSDHYVFYKKGVGIAHYFYTGLNYPED